MPCEYRQARSERRNGYRFGRMRERVHEPNGKLEIESDGRGTRMRTTVPLSIRSIRCFFLFSPVAAARSVGPHGLNAGSGSFPSCVCRVFLYDLPFPTLLGEPSTKRNGAHALDNRVASTNDSCHKERCESITWEEPVGWRSGCL